MFDTSTRIDKNDPLPRHAQVQRILREMVTSGRLKPGDKIPAELQIADALGVSKMTVNKALLALTASGFFVREVGRGTFVASPEIGRVGNGVNGNGNGHAPEALAAHRVALSFVQGARNVLDSDYYGSIYRGVADVLEAQELTEGMSLTPTAADDYEAEDRRSPADGRLIIAPRASSVASIQALWDAGKDVVVVGASWPSMGVPSVDSDNIGGAVEAVRYLTDLGHRRIALLMVEPETANTQDRIVGYRRALTMAGVTPRPEWEVCADKVWEVGPEASRRLVALFNDPAEPVTAVFAAGHYLALGAMNVARDAGRRVPEDVSVVGYDDPLSAQLVYPALTTVRQPLYELGKRAAERLARLMRGEDERAAIREVLPAQLVVRRSTAPAAR
jgi:DNA-binding LacI/PurR family transcriptional regulator